MKILRFVLAMFPVFAFAQNGVHFQNGLNWQQIKEKATNESKFIFVDLFATWCGPCKLMDKNVYPNDSVGDFINRNFVAVKVQCDSSKNDNDDVKAWYVDAHKMQLDYKITAYPTFLFFSPGGQLIHKGLGYQPADAFLALGRDALDPHKQYYTLLRNYQEGNKEYSIMPYIASMAQKFQDGQISRSIATDYIHNHLDGLPDSDFLTEENITFVANYPDILGSKERLFGWSLRQPAKVDSIIHDKGFSRRVINYVIDKEVIEPLLHSGKKSGTTPNWSMLSISISQNFGLDYVKENVLDAKVKWYRQAKDWKNYTRYLVSKTEYDQKTVKVPKDFWGFAGLNSIAWDIFQYSNNKKELQKAVTWSDIVVTNIEPKTGPNYGTFVDTKANLLYKLGMKHEALVLEAKASTLTPNDKDVQEAYLKMRQGKPTW